MIVSWTAFKQFVQTRTLSVQWIEDSQSYFLAAVDGAFKVETSLLKANTNSELEDFEANFKAAGNIPLTQLDTDGAQIVRNKAAKKGWTFGAMPIEFSTSRLQSDSSFYSKTVDDSNRSGVTLKIYNDSDVEITTPGAFNANLATAVKTVIDFEPAYDYELIGGSLRTITEISANIRMWIIGVPDISAEYGGSKEMCGGINLNYLVPQNTLVVDGRVSKSLKYDATYHTNKLRFIFKYPAGTAENIQIMIEHYKS